MTDNVYTVIMTKDKNTQVQELIGDAIQHVLSFPFHSDDIVMVKREMLVSFLKLAKAYTASGNSIPVLGGKGLEEVMVLAESVLEGQYDSDFRFDFKATANGLLFV